MSDLGKDMYERVSAIAEALPDTRREEFAALLEDLQRNAIDPGSIRGNSIRRWLKDAGWLR